MQSTMPPARLRSEAAHQDRALLSYLFAFLVLQSVFDTNLPIEFLTSFNGDSSWTRSWPYVVLLVGIVLMVAAALHLLSTWVAYVIFGALW
jgi:hypothetical protein